MYKVAYEFLSSENIAQYIAYLHRAVEEEPKMQWVQEVDESGIRERVNDPFYRNTKSILAMVGDAVAGRIEYHFYGCLQDGYRMAYVDWVYVLPEYRHIGMAQGLFREFEKDCLAHKIDQYYLIRATNPGADKFYHSFESAELSTAPTLRKNIGDT